MRVVVASLAIGLLPTFLVGALSVPIGDDLDVGAATIGAAVSAFFLAAALTSVPAGRQVDRRGAAFGYRVGLTGVGLTAGAVGLLVGAGWHLVVAFAFAGASLAFVDPSITRTITGSVGWRRHGIAFGVKESAVPSASMIAGITLPLLGATIGWQVPFLVVAVLAVGLAALVPSSIEVAAAPRDSSRTISGTSKAARGASRNRRGQSGASRGASLTRRGSSRGGQGSSRARWGVSREGQGPSSATGDGSQVVGPVSPASPSGGATAPAVSATVQPDTTRRPAEGPADGRSAGPSEGRPAAYVTGADPDRSRTPASGPGEQASDARGGDERTRDQRTRDERTRDQRTRDERTGDERDGEHASGGLALLAIASGLGGGAGAAVATFIVPTGIVIGMGATAAGLVLSVASLGSIAVRLGAGWLVDRRPRVVFDLLVALLAAGLVGGIALAAAAHLGAAPVEVDALAGTVAVAGETAPAAAGVVTLLVIGAVLLLGPGWGWTGLVFLTATRLTPERPAQASGAILAGLGGGGALFPLGAGWLAESVGFGWTWTVVAFAMSLSVALMMVVRARR